MKKPITSSVFFLPGFLILFSILCLPVSGQVPVKQGKPVPAGFRIAPAVVELHRMINDYREQNNLPPIRLSRSLCYVAALHVKDLSLNHPDSDPCNAHSWSANGFWKPFCYPRDENKKNSVWNKPRELTRYPSQAYEIVYWENIRLVPDSVFTVWKTEEYFNNFLLNGGKWKEVQWKAIGIALNDSYASAWFGEMDDPEETDGHVSDAGKTAKDTAKPAAIVKKPTKPVKKPGIKKGPVIVKTDTLVTKPADSASIPPAGKPVPGDTTASTYYIIVKTNLTAEAAGKLARELKTKDYPEARVLTYDNKIRISVFESPVKSIANTKLREVKKRFHDAWLYKSVQRTVNN